MIVLTACLLAAALYAVAWRRPVRLLKTRWRWNARHWRATAFFGGLCLSCLVTSPPVEELTRRFFWVLSAQRMALATAIAPLLVVGAPAALARRRLSRLGARMTSALGSPLAAFLAFNGALVFVMLPVTANRVAASTVVTDGANLLLLLFAAWFWAQVIDQPPIRCRLRYLGRAAYLLLGSMTIRVLGLIAGFAPAPFYSHYVSLEGWRAALGDQQLGAGIMLVPGVLTDTIVLAVCLFLWLGSEARIRAGDAGGGTRTRAWPFDRRALA
jgi:cytochrome c oxidase assembly factor CtaG